MTTTAPNPYLVGNYAPVTEEVTAFDLPVTGHDPAELDGRYLRNGPNPISADPAALPLVHGRRHGARHRACGTAGPSRTATAGCAPTRSSPRPGRDAPDGPPTCPRRQAASPTPTSIGHAGAMFAPRRGRACPYELDRRARHRRPLRLRRHAAGRRDRAPEDRPASRARCCLRLRLGWARPWLRYHVVDAAGALVRSSRTSHVNGPSMVHDFAITERHVLFLDLPVVFDFDLHGPADRSRPLERRLRRPGRRACPATAATPTCAGSTSSPATCSTRSTPTTTATAS